MPRLTTDANGQPQYTQTPPITITPNSNMAYYTRSAMPGTYYGEVPQQQNHQTMTAYDQYAVGTAPLTIAPAGGPVGPSGLPAQHRASSGAWTASEDQTLLAARQSGQNWTQIQAAYFPTKTPNACRKRHERLMERRGADDWDTRKMEQIAKEYMAMRKEIWAPLALRTGQKWHVVEQKVSPHSRPRVYLPPPCCQGLTEDLLQCMSNGLKNIQSHARSYSRKQRNGQQGIPNHGYDDDSAVSGIGLTPVDDLDPAADGGYSSPETSASSTSSGVGGRAAGASSVQHPHNQDQYDGTHSMSSSFQGYPHQPYGHGYSSSVSSSGTPAYQSGGQVNGHVAQHEPSYQPAPRQSSIDMDIRAIMNRPTGGANMRQV
jgi:hypothetical protein